MNHSSAWRGLHGYHQLVNQKIVSGPWIDRTGLYRAKQNPLTRAQATPAHFTIVYTVTLTPPTLWETMDSDAYHQHCTDLAQGAIKSARVKRKGKSIGMARVLTERMYKARFVRRAQRPLCRTKCIDRLKLYKSEYFGFKARFQEVYRALLDGGLPKVPRLDLLFPSGGALPLGAGSLIQLE